MTEKKMVQMKNLKNKKLYMQVYEELRSYILKQQLRPGDKLPTEMEMCQTLGVSRNVLREAIKALEITGIVTSKSGVGIVIQEFNPDFMFEMLFYNLTRDGKALLDQTLSVRRVLELGFLSESYASISSKDIVDLKKQLNIMEQVASENKDKEKIIFGEKFYTADANFHNILYRGIKNAILSSIIDAVWRCDCFYKKQVESSILNESIEKHQKIIDALEKRDRNAYIEAMNQHFNFNYKVEGAAQD